MLTAEQLTALAALVSAVGVIVTAVLQFAARDRVKVIEQRQSEIHAAVTTGNGETLGMNSDAIRGAIAPVQHDDEAAASA